MRTKPVSFKHLVVLAALSAGCVGPAATPGQPCATATATGATTVCPLVGTVRADVRFLAGPSGTTPLTRNEADALMCELRSTPLVPLPDGKVVPMRFDQIRDDCYHRAEVAVDHLQKSHPGMVLGKVFVSGKLSVFGEEIKWGFHVAPYTLVKEADREVIAVLDPAVDAEQMITLEEWLGALGGVERVFLTGPTAWGFGNGAPSAPVDEDVFQKNVAAAAHALADFEARNPRIQSTHPSVVVDSLDDRGLVVFRNPATGAKTSRMGVRRDVRDRLRGLGDKHLFVCSQREYSGNALKDLVHWARNDIEVVYDVEPVGEAYKCIAPHNVACGGAREHAPGQHPQAKSVFVGGRLAADARWAPIAGALIDKVHEVIDSPRFAEVVATHRGMHTHVGLGGKERGLDVLASYLGIRQERRRAPAWLTIGGKAMNPAATTLCNSDAFAQIRIAPIVLERWERTTPKSKACAINTLAHEMTHTVIDRTTHHPAQMFTDGAHLLANLFHEELVSYTIGTLAQCVYLELEDKSPRTDPQKRAALEACLHTYGTREFWVNQCDDPPGGPTWGDPSFTPEIEPDAPPCSIDRTPP